MLPALSNRPRLIVVVGPTCTGKSDLGIALAKAFGGEVVNADAMQVYRRFDIGTAKPGKAEQGGIPHHLIDVVEPDEPFNAAEFLRRADDAIALIASRGKIPVVVGGTGLYVRTLIYGLFPAPGSSEVRTRIAERFIADPGGTYRRLNSVDPEYAQRVSPNDRIRVVRALEIFEVTGKTMTQWEALHGFREPRYAAFRVGLTLPREELYRRINARVDAMLKRGWVSEVRALLDAGYSEGLKPFSGIGYREIVLYIKGLMGYEVMAEEIKKNTRRYGKRQFTWFAKEKEIRWYGYPEEESLILSDVDRFLR